MEKNNYIEFQKVRDFGAIIGDTFDFIIKNIKPFAKSVLIIMIPNFLIFFLWMRMFGPNYFLKMTPNNFNILTPTFWLLLLTTIVFSFVYMVLTVCVNYDYIKLYIERKGGAISFADLWSAIKKDFMRVLLNLIGLGIAIVIITAVLVLLFVLIGFVSKVLVAILTPLAIIILGTYCLVAMWPVLFVVIYEKSNIFKAIFRSFQLVFGKWWFTFGLLNVIMIIWTIFISIASIPYYILIFLLALHGMENPTNYFYPLLAVTFILLTFIGSLTYLIPQTAIALHYFSLKEKKEASSLFAKIEKIES